MLYATQLKINVRDHWNQYDIVTPVVIIRPTFCATHR